MTNIILSGCNGKMGKAVTVKSKRTVGSEFADITYIEDVATENEMETALKIRKTEGKHVIPVPTVEVKSQFSGYFLNPLKIFIMKKLKYIDVVMVKHFILEPLTPLEALALRLC